MRYRTIIVSALLLTGLLAGCGDDGPVSSSVHLEDLVDETVVNLEHWKVTRGGNDHYYGVIPIELYRDEVGRLVSSYSVEPWVAYLATVTSERENAFILECVVAGTDQPSILDAFWIDALYEGGEWSWSTGEAFDYTNWAPGEPNNVGIETAMTMWGANTTDPRRVSGKWNDSLPDSTVNDLARYWAVVEFEKQDRR